MTCVYGLLAIPFAAACAVGVAGAQDTGLGTLADLSLEELSEIRVFSASRRLEPVAGTPAAVYVVTGEDLLRSGVTSIPDALRLVPGVQVGRVDANKWAVSMRGFNSREANKLLVLVDGRSIYDPLFSGMLWESHDFLLEDIERIEVIRGPGGTLWGANAFNGVINIITRTAEDSQGTVASLAVGDEQRYIAGLRHGWQLNDSQHARVYVNTRERDTGYSADFPPADAATDVRAGFRWDRSNGGPDALRISADVFDATAGVRESAVLAHDVSHRGRNLLAQWSRQLSAQSTLNLQFFYDHVDYDSVGFMQERDSYDLTFQQSFSAGSRHLIVWGGDYRRIQDTSRSKVSFVEILPEHRNDELEAVFVQDTVRLVPDRLELVVGAKYENTDYADAQWLPNLRVAWTPDADRTWWAALSEATRVPSRLESDLTFLGTLRLGDRFGAEHVRAYELGHRRLVSSALWYDAAVFYNDYDDLRTTEADGTLHNLMHGHTWGAELAVRWDASSRVSLDAAYTYLDMGLSLDAESTGAPSLAAQHEGLVSRHQVALRADFDIGRDVNLNSTLRYVDDLPTLAVPAYTQLDLAATWRPVSAWELSLVGSNLLDAHHPEQDFAFSGSGLPTEVERGVYMRARWGRRP